MLRETELQPLKDEINALFSESDEVITHVCETVYDDCDLIYVMSSKSQLYILMNGKVADRQTTDMAKHLEHFEQLKGKISPKVQR